MGRVNAQGIVTPPTSALESVGHVVGDDRIAKEFSMRHLLLVLILLIGVMPDTEAAYRKREVRHAIIVGYGDKSADMEVLDCKYGEVNVGLGPGSCHSGSAPLADFFTSNGVTRRRDRYTRSGWTSNAASPPPREDGRKQEGQKGAILGEKGDLQVQVSSLPKNWAQSCRLH